MIKCMYCGKEIPVRELKDCVPAIKDGEKVFAHKRCFAENVRTDLW